MIRSKVKVPDTFQELAIQILSDIPLKHMEIFIACDSYIWIFPWNRLNEFRLLSQRNSLFQVLKLGHHTIEKKMFSIKDFLSKCDHISMTLYKC